MAALPSSPRVRPWRCTDGPFQIAFGVEEGLGGPAAIQHSGSANASARWQGGHGGSPSWRWHASCLLRYSATSKPEWFLRTLRTGRKRSGGVDDQGLSQQRLRHLTCGRTRDRTRTIRLCRADGGRQYARETPFARAMYGAGCVIAKRSSTRFTRGRPESAVVRIARALHEIREDRCRRVAELAGAEALKAGAAFVLAMLGQARRAFDYAGIKLARPTIMPTRTAAAIRQNSVRLRTSIAVLHEQEGFATRSESASIVVGR
jgi:hypothetical protein